MNQIIEGEVVGGNRIGNKLGFPTANVAMEEGSHIRDGVYAAVVKTTYGVFRGMASVGTRPTVTESPERWAEVNIFDFDNNLYGSHITIELVKFMRPQEKFDSIDELRKKIEEDKNSIKHFFESNDKQ